MKNTPSSTAKSSILLSLAVLLVLNAPASCSSDSFNNVLISGYPLNAGGSLVQGKYNFTMQHDCNLVMYESEVVIWSSQTGGKGSNCSLVLQNNGELFISTAAGIIVWRSGTGGEFGHFVLVIQSNGDVVVYVRHSVVHRHL
ncbi:Mannose-specific lectin [Dendrobium catenatum]|uniref:Mannose-specific lectin n=2 Tax=Dendrobium catenatum TaxID=906689 RepID=A0A2I0X093_9ASPA|nr:Mannose-specific lectin [Dendrobium catenatum]